MEVVGITYNQLESGIYAVILEEEGGGRRVPIVIGESEAQAIQCKLQEIQMPRPLTHDLFLNTLKSLGVMLAGVEIYMMANGVFAANLYIHIGNGPQKIVDSRASDAIALALRAEVPIFMEDSIIAEIGFKTKEAAIAVSKDEKREEVHGKSELDRIMDGDIPLSSLSEAELRIKMDEALEIEFYELAAVISAEMRKRGLK